MLQRVAPEPNSTRIQIERQRVESSSPLSAAILRLLDESGRITLAEVVAATGGTGIR